MRVFITAAAVLTSLLSLALAVPASADGAAITEVSTGLVAPGGARGNSSVIEIPDDASITHVGDQLQVLDANGTVLHTFAVEDPTPAAAAAPALKTGWITFASWMNNGNSPIKTFSTTWEVPPEPQAKDGQTVFLFNSIEPGKQNAILQPVLQFGPSAAGGGAYWSVASWWVGSSHTLHTKLVKVNPGATLHGLITLTAQNGDNFNYNSKFTNVGGTSLNVKNVSELKWATETLEAYRINKTADYPAGKTVFSGINLKLANGNVPSVKWNTAQDSKDGIKTTVNKDGAKDAEITITY
ncbi:hypothetical protein MVEN_01717400 [Mycena venus]|uniref:Uncharacterized protein n=1 Tax=Mycena venus TaxID=2733690 RepID=A0A8H7CQ86_9AGAR|nr:hypothetical protein MVEN_01717400 [Mycena venus]